MQKLSKRKAVLVQYKKRRKPAIKIHFDYLTDKINNFKDLKAVRSIPGRKYNKEGKFWVCPLSIDAVEILKEARFILDPKLEEFLNKQKLTINEVKEIKITGLKKKLYPYQNKGVAFLEQKGGRGLIADEMGLGKTIQALAWVQLHPEKRPVVIVCPASLKLNWVKEIKESTESKDSVEVLQGRTPYKPTSQIIIINYDILPYWKEKLKKIKHQILIADEVHYAKNNKAKRTKALKLLSRHSEHFIGLTGTPIENRPADIYNAVNMIDSTIFPNFFTFAKRYCNAKHNGFGWDMSGASNIKELHEKLTNTVMVRRLKKDVLPDLPEKIYSFVPMEIDNFEEYNQAQDNFINYVKDQVENEVQTKTREAMHQLFESDIPADVVINDHKLKKLKEEKADKVNILTEIEGLKQLAVKGKMKSVINWIRDFLETNDKLVVFASHKFVINELMKEFKNIAVKIDGSVKQADRNKAVECFQNDPRFKLFIGNMKAAGTGYTLTASSNVAVIEYPWTPSELSQAIDRCHRIGQKNSVNAYFLIGENTIEEDIVKLLNEKSEIIEGVIDGKDVNKEGSMLNDLIKNFSNK